MGSEMELYIAGGCGEHGRNCFWFAEGEDAYLVDCGRMAGVEFADSLPRLNKEQIENLRGVFLTHSHADHSAALPWLFQQGYKGPVSATAPTFAQLPFACENALCLEELCKLGKGIFRDVSIMWGLSGHCAGSVWLQFDWHGKTILFSGDYTEQSEVYPCDKIRGKKADLAVLDCAYGTWTPEKGDGREEAALTVRELLDKTPLVFLPVPKYGRGLDLLCLLHRLLAGQTYYGDEHFCRQVQSAAREEKWYRCESIKPLRQVQPDADEKEGIIFLSDPQLRGETGRRAMELLDLGAAGMMTGTVDKGSLSERLIDSGAMRMCKYPVHLNDAMCRELIGQNRFQKVIRYHSPEYAYGRRIEV